MTAVGAPARPMTGLRRMLITACAMIATLMQALDTTNATMALPYMRSSLSAGPDQITWVLTSYVIMAAIMTACVGWFAKRFGHRRCFLIAMAGFTIASMLSGQASSLTEIVIFRLLQGAFGAALIPLSQSTLLDIYPVEQRGSALSIWGIGVMVGPVVGPSIGGYITEMYHWRWIFYINVPIGIVAFTGLWLLLDKDKERSDDGHGFDWLGFGFLATAIGAFQLMLDRGERLGWFTSTEIIIELVVGCLCLYLFIVQVLTARRPLVSREMFADRNFAAAFVMLLLFGAILLSSTALVALYLQNMAGYPILDAGIMLAPRGLGTMLGMIIVGRISNQVDPRLIILAGIALMSGSFYYQSGWTPDIDPWTLGTTTFVQGAGFGMVFIPLNVVAFATLPSQYRTDASAFVNLIRYVGQAIGVSVLTSLLLQNTQIMHARIGEFVTPYNFMLHSGGAHFGWSTLRPSGIMRLNDEVTRQAAISAYSTDFLVLMGIALSIVLFLPLIRGRQIRGQVRPR